MAPRLIKTGQLLLLAALLSTCGMHWVLLQSVAWMRMIVNYSQTSDLMTAITDTFDGDHPCPLCKQIKVGKTTEKKQDLLVVAEKLNLFHQPSIITLAIPANFQIQFAPSVEAAILANEPPTPPPRSELV